METHALWDIDDVFCGCNTKEEKVRTSPISYVSQSCPPTLLCAGTSDYLVYGNSSERLFAKLEECGIHADLILSVCGGHAFEQIYKDIKPRASLERTQKYIIDFILRI